MTDAHLKNASDALDTYQSLTRGLDDPHPRTAGLLASALRCIVRHLEDQAAPDKTAATMAELDDVRERAKVIIARTPKSDEQRSLEALQAINKIVKGAFGP